jgi:hypothetical protein
MVEMIEGMRRISKSSLQIFQKGIIMSCKSLEGLYEFLKERYSVEYILTHRLNQDCLVIFFSQVSCIFYFKYNNFNKYS